MNLKYVQVWEREKMVNSVYKIHMFRSQLFTTLMVQQVVNQVQVSREKSLSSWIFTLSLLVFFFLHCQCHFFFVSWPIGFRKFWYLSSCANQSQEYLAHHKYLFNYNRNGFLTSGIVRILVFYYCFIILLYSPIKRNSTLQIFCWFCSPLSLLVPSSRLN